MRPLKELKEIIQSGSGSVRLPGVGVVTTVEDLEKHYDGVKASVEAAREEMDARRREVRLGRGGLVAPGTAQAQQALAEKEAEIERLKAQLASAKEAAAPSTAGATSEKLSGKPAKTSDKPDGKDGE